MRDTQTLIRVAKIVDRIHVGKDRLTEREREAIAEAERLLESVAARHCPEV